MSKDVRKNIRIPTELADFVTILAASLNISENDAYKMIVFEYFKNCKNDLFYIKRG